MKYIIIEKSQKKRFIREVNKHLEQGWLCQGGIHYNEYESIKDGTSRGLNRSYLQAMVKTSE